MDVKSEINHLSATRKELVIEAPAEMVQKEFDKTYAALSRSAKVAGFRPGKVPRSVIKQKFHREARDTVTGQLVPQAIRTALEKHHLQLISEPKIHDVSLQEGQPLKFKTTVEVLPQVDVTNYKGLRVRRTVKTVTEAEVDQALEQLRQQHGQLVPIDNRPTQLGDFATITLATGAAPPTAKEDPGSIKGEVIEIEIGGQDVLPEFSQALTGMLVGETRQIRVAYPSNYHSAQLAGKEVEYEVTLEALRVKELPDLDDEFLKTIGEDYETLADFHQELKRRLQEAHEQEADEALKETVLQQLVEAHPFEVPESMVRHRLDTRIRNLAQAAMLQGIDPESKDIDWQAIAQREQEQAIRDVRAALILQHIAEQESLSVSPAELDAAITSLAAQRRESAIQLKGRLTKEGSLDSMKNEMRNRKALEWVVKAAVVEREVVDGDM